MRPVAPPGGVRYRVIAPADARRAARAAARHGAEWCYFGTDIALRERAARALGAASRVSVGDELTRLACDTKQPFLDWVTAVGNRQPDPVVWWGSTLASRSPLQTDFFMLVCYAELVRRWLEEDRGSPVRIIVVEDPWLALVLRRRYAGDPRVAFAGSRRVERARDLAGWFGRAALTTARTALWAVNSMLRTKRLFRGGGGVQAAPARQAVLLYSWIEPRCFAVPGKLVDPWTGRLTELLASHGEEVRRLTSLEIPARLATALAAFVSQLIVTPRYLRIGDIARAALCWFRVRGRGMVAPFQEGDLAPLLRREELLEWGRGDFTRYRLLYFAMRRIASQHGRHVKCVIYPFENQPWEKLFCLAWRERAPHVKLIGYQHADVPSLLLPYSLGRGEYKTVPLPDWIVANSEFNLARLREGGYPSEKLVNGGALRHEYLTEISLREISQYGNAAGSTRRDPGSPRHARGGIAGGASSGERLRTVLVTLPLSQPDSSCLFADLLEAFREPLVVGPSGERPVQVVVKCHPSLPLRAFYRGRLMLPPWIRFSHEPMEKLLSGVALVLYVGPTSSWWEALLSGVPVMKYRTDVLDIDSGHAVDGWTAPRCTRETLRSSIASFLDHPPVAIKPDAAVAERMLGRVKEDVWLTLAGRGSNQ